MEINDTILTTKTITEFVFYKYTNPPIKVSFDTLLDYKLLDKVKLEVSKSANVKAGVYQVLGREKDKIRLNTKKEAVVIRNYFLKYIDDLTN